MMSSAKGGSRIPAGTELDRLLSWFEANGGSVSKLCLEDLGGDMSLSIMTQTTVRKGDVVMSVPISLCMTVESAGKSDLAIVLEGNPDLMSMPDEVLAMHLMTERRRGDQSFWKEYIRTLPDDVDTPLRWIVEGAEDVCLLDGTMVGLLSKMMHSQVVKDWREVHLPLIEAHPDILGGIVFEDYMWALSSIWSRAFDYLEQSTNGSISTRRAMVPVLNAANHDPSAAGALSEMIEFKAGAVGSEGIGSGGTAGGRLRVVAGRHYGEREQFFLLYGRYSNAKLLYSYGFVLPDNPYGGLDYWTRVPAGDPNFGWKQALLDEHPLTATQAYDFSGTLRSGGWISPALLATARVAQLTSDERPSAEKAFQGEMVSPRNEEAMIGALLVGLRRKLAAQGASLADEEQLVARLEADQRQQRRRGLQRGHEGIEDGESDTRAENYQQHRVDEKLGASTPHEEGVPGAGTAGGPPSGATEKGSRPQAGGVPRGLERQLAAARVRLEEKSIVTEAIGALERSLVELQSAVASGRLASFRTLDSGSR